jgi:hypothetical protein
LVEKLIENAVKHLNYAILQLNTIKFIWKCSSLCYLSGKIILSILQLIGQFTQIFCRDTPRSLWEFPARPVFLWLTWRYPHECVHKGGGDLKKFLNEFKPTFF